MLNSIQAIHSLLQLQWRAAARHNMYFKFIYRELWTISTPSFVTFTSTFGTPVPESALFAVLLWAAFLLPTSQVNLLRIAEISSWNGVDMV